MPVEIRSHEPGVDLEPFLDAARRVYRDDRNWVPHLDMELRDRLTPNKNPFFEHGEAKLFTAWRDDQPVGRCSVQLDHEHLRIHDDGAAFFGFFDTLEDQEAAHALLQRATEWARRRGMITLRGPYSLNINEELGMLVEGFDSPPMIMMPHHHPYQGSLVEKCGFTKAKDLFAWRFEYANTELKPRAQRAWQAVQDMPEISLRSVRRDRMEEDLGIILEVFNDAWHENWGFVPATKAEAKKMADDMKLIIDEDIAIIAELDGQPAAICLALPNINEAIHDLDGKLFPFGLLKLLYRLKVRGPRTGRLMMLGIRSDLRNVRKYAGLSVALYAEIFKRGQRKGYQWGELSWTLEDNHAVNAGIRAMGGKVYKRYRLYEKEIEA